MQTFSKTKPKRRLFAVAALLSCLLAVVSAASWVRSYRVYDQLSCGSVSGRYQCAWGSYDASGPLHRWPPGMPKEASHAVLASFGKIFLRQSVYNEEPLGAPASRGYGWASDDNAIPSFSYFYAVTGSMTGTGHWTVRQITVRHWALVLLFALLPAGWLLAWSRRSAR